MTKLKRRHTERDFTPTHPDAAAIDIGSRMHVAAVPPDRDSEPVRAFGTCTGDLHQLADWFERCGVRTVAMEFHRRLLDTCLRTARAARIRSGAGQRPRRQARAGTQDRR